MALRQGMPIGPYEILEAIGTGGMGEVYRARDTRLGRDVAVKVATSDRPLDAATRARFEREMAIAARLTHPRICVLHDVGIDNDRLYIVMELVVGETLATRLERVAGPGLPWREALDIAAGLCDALAFAHRHGVVHRDVKPANIMLTKGGVKLLDFGIARLYADDTVVQSASATAPHAFIGTPAYMAPEQLDGLADARADLFAVGAVLYEMLAGRRAFPGDTTSEALASVARCQPEPLSEIRPDLPTAVIRAVHRCLRKHVDDRWQSGADLREALHWALDFVVPGGNAPVPPRAAARWAPTRWLAALALVLGIGAVTLGYGRAVPSAEFYVDDVTLPDGQRFLPGQSSWASDGRHVAVVTQAASGSRLWIREIGRSGDWQLVDGAGAEFVTYPSWSPDGRSLAYFRGRELVRRSLSSSAPVSLAEAPEGRGTTWLDHDTILFAPDAQGDIWRVPSAGGTPSIFIRREPEDLGVKFPAAVGGGRLLYWAQRSELAASEVRAVSVETPDASRTIVRSAKAAASTDGHLFFVQDNVLVAQPVDERTLTLRGRAEPLPVELGLGGHIGAPFLTAGGRVAGVESVRRETKQLQWVDRLGRPLETVGAAAPYRTMSLSPDGRRLLVEQTAPGLDTATIWLIDLETGGTRRLATEVGASLPVWHPAQDRMAFRASTGPGGSGAVEEQRLDGNARRLLVDVLAAARPAGWTPRGDLVWWAGDVSGRLNGIFIRTAQGLDQSYRRIQLGAEARAVAVRHDGTYVAFSSNESGRFEVYVDTLPSPRAVPWKVTSGGGGRPRWSRDGKELYFVSDGFLQVIAVGDRGPSGASSRLFAFEDADFDVHPDGRVLVQRRQRPDAPYLRVFRNWSRQPANSPQGGAR